MVFTVVSYAQDFTLKVIMPEETPQFYLVNHVVIRKIPTNPEESRFLLIYNDADRNRVESYFVTSCKLEHNRITVTNFLQFRFVLELLHNPVAC